MRFENKMSQSPYNCPYRVFVSERIIKYFCSRYNQEYHNL
jgi:hypothetical protein